MVEMAKQSRNIGIEKLSQIVEVFAHYSKISAIIKLTSYKNNCQIRNHGQLIRIRIRKQLIGIQSDPQT